MKNVQDWFDCLSMSRLRLLHFVKQENAILGGFNLNAVVTPFKTVYQTRVSSLLLLPFVGWWNRLWRGFNRHINAIYIHKFIQQTHMLRLNANRQNSSSLTLSGRCWMTAKWMSGHAYPFGRVLHTRTKGSRTSAIWANTRVKFDSFSFTIDMFLILWHWRIE